MEELHIRAAGTADLDTILGLTTQASAWLREKDTDQWQRPWPTPEGRDARIIRGLLAHETWIVEAWRRPVATVTCHQHGNRDRQLWNEDELSEPTAFVSRLIVNREFAGMEIGSALIHWAGRYALRNWGAKWIRIDVWTTNQALHRYYQGQGFSFVRFSESGGPVFNPSAALFQKSTSGLDTIAADRFIGGEPAMAVPLPAAGNFITAD